MPSEPISIGPWMGIDNVHHKDARVFQPPGELEKRLPVLQQALDVDLDDDGWPSSRPPTVSISDLVQCFGGWEIEGRLFLQEASTLYEFVGAKTPLITGLVSRVSMCEHWGKIYITDGAQHWMLSGQEVLTWGLPVPAISLTPATGQMVPGRYLVQCAFVDAAGNEGGASDVAVASLSSATGITVSLSGASPSCVSVNVYISDRDQKQTTFFATIPLGAFSYTIQTTAPTVADPPKTQQMTGPISGAAGVFSFRAFLLLWRDGVVFRSEAAEPHLFHGENLIQFGSTVRACESVAGGMWIGTGSGLWWVAGEDPAGWVPVRKTFDAVAQGSKKVQGGKIPRVGTDNLIALFVTASGLVAGMPDGTVAHLTDGTYAFNPTSRASIAYVERDNLRQLIINLVGA